MYMIKLYSESGLSSRYINQWSPSNRPTLDPPLLDYTHILIHFVRPRWQKWHTCSDSLHNAPVIIISSSLSPSNIYVSLVRVEVVSNREATHHRAIVCHCNVTFCVHAVLATVSLSERRFKNNGTKAKTKRAKIYCKRGTGVSRTREQIELFKSRRIFIVFIYRVRCTRVCTAVC